MELRDRFARQAQSLKEDGSQLVALGSALHDSIIRWTGNELLAEIYELLRKQTKLLRNVSQKRLDLESRSFGEHVAILDAIEEGDPELAEKLMREHLERTNEDVLEWLVR